MMKAAVVRDNPRRLVIENVNIPSCAENDALIKIKACGLCGSDVHGLMDPASKGRVDGLIMGHEASGVVEAVGDGVKNFKQGDRVVIDPQFRCGTCYACKQSYYNICENGGIIGSALRGYRNGCFAEYVVVPATHLHILPKGMSFDEGALIEPVANAIHATNRACIKIGDNVAIIGAGTIGLCMIQAVKNAGAAKVISIDISDYHLSMAKKFGADYIINSTKCDPVEAVKKICGDIGTDVTIEAVGIGSTYRQASLMTKKRGTLAFFGAAKPTAEIDLYPLLHRELNMVGCTGFDIETDIGLSMIEDNKIDVKPLITHRFPLEKVQDAVDTFLSPNAHVLKALIVSDD